MKNSPSNRRHQHKIDDEAAGWVVRQERGLSATEQDAYHQWLATDPRHSIAFAEQRRSWEELDRLNGLQSCVHAVPDPKLLVPRQRQVAHWARFTLVPLTLAAAIVMIIYLARQPESTLTLVVPQALPALCVERKLTDGSLLTLNRGASVTVAFTSSTREVRLNRGEANFAVAHDPVHPFVVKVAGVAVRAVGTAFSVLREQNSVTVLVTEGKVKVLSSGASSSDSSDATVVSAGQRAVVSMASNAPSPAIIPVSSEEMAEHLAWKPHRLNFDEATLAEIAAEFNRCNPIHLIISDPVLRRRRLSASIRSDNVEGFLKLIQTDFGIRNEQRGKDIIDGVSVVHLSLNDQVNPVAPNKVQ